MNLTERTVQSSRRTGGILPAVVACVLATAILLAMGAAVHDASRMALSPVETPAAPAIFHTHAPAHPRLAALR